MITENKKPVPYWTAFNSWLSEDGGLGIIVQWAHDFLESHAAVSPGAPSPWTVTKAGVIEESYSEGMTMVADILKSIKECEGKEWHRCCILDADLVGLIRDNLYDGRHSEYLEKARTIRRAAKDLGWFPRLDKTCLGDGTSGKMICLDPNDAKRPYAELYREVRPTRIRKLGKRKLVPSEEGSMHNIRRTELEDEAHGNVVKLVPK
jgi:hypothetical protein